MNRLGRIVSGVTGGLMVLAGVGWLGLQVSPPNLPLPAEPPQDLGTVKRPDNLPDPVSRYLQASLGDDTPRIESVLVVGRARANFGIWLPLRYRLTHVAGYEFERTMEITWLGLPLLKAIDRYVDGVGMTGPLGRAATGPAIDQGANMILWAEGPLMPSLWAADDRIHWEAVDDETALLIFPFDESEDELTVRFDPESRLVSSIEALRYRDAESGKVPWRVDFLSWQTVNDVRLPERVAIIWEDQGKPWSYWDFENVLWNVGWEE